MLFWVLLVLGGFLCVLFVQFGIFFTLFLWLFLLFGVVVPGTNFEDNFNDPFVGVNASLRYKESVYASISFFYLCVVPLSLAGSVYCIFYSRCSRRFCPIEGSLPGDPFNAKWNLCAQQCSKTHYDMGGESDDGSDSWGRDVYTCDTNCWTMVIVSAGIGLIFGLVFVISPLGNWDFMYNNQGIEPSNYTVIRFIATGIPYIFSVGLFAFVAMILAGLVMCIAPYCCLCRPNRSKDAVTEAV